MVLVASAHCAKIPTLKTAEKTEKNPLSRSESWKNWLIILAVLIFSGLMTALWPAISSNLSAVTGSATSAPSLPAETVTIPPLPLPFLDQGFTLTSIQVLLGFAVFVVGGVAVTGIIIAIANLLLSRWTTRVANSESYIDGTAVLAQRQKAELAAAQEAHPSDAVQQRDYSRWAVLATSLVILFFATVGGYMFASTFFPEGSIVRNENIVNIVGIITLAVVLLTLLYLFFRMDEARLVEVNTRDDLSFTWDTIVVIALGALVVGLGIGLILFLNQPG